MAGKKKAPPSPRGTPSSSASDPEAAAKVAGLKAEAEKHYVAKNYVKASDSYEQAAKLTADAPEKAELLVKSAGCYLQEKRYKDVIKTCTAVLDQTPGSTAALQARAKAYEQMGFFKQALADAQAVNKGDAASDETKEMERRLREVMSTNKAKLAATGSQGLAKADGAGKASSFPYTITIKAALGDEVRVMHASLVVSYAELLGAVKEQFPTAGPIVLKYCDKDGDYVTMTSRVDIQTVLSEMVMQYQRQMQSSNAPKLSNQLPAMRIKVVKVNSEADVPKPPADELANIMETKLDDLPQQQQYEIDEWLVQFARMFTEVTGIDPVANQEHLHLGHDKILRAVDACLSDPKALPLFDKAAEHFRDATCTSFVQWGNLHIIRADRQAQTLLKAGQALEGKPLDAILKEYDESEKKFNEALRIKAESWEAMGSMGQLEWERAKAKIGYVLPTPPQEEAANKEEADASKEAVEAAVKAALAKIDVKKVGQIQKHMDSMNKWFDKALGFATAAEEKKKLEEAASAPEGQAEASKAEPTAEQRLQSAPGNMLVMHGNIIYEWSQVLAAVGKPWKPVLDSAVEKFRSAGAAEADVRSALKNHSKSNELDLGPEPEAEKAPEPVKEEAANAPDAAAQEEKAKAPEAKGLPSLEVKKKGKA